MDKATVTVEIPAEALARANRIAKSCDLTTESVMSDALIMYFGTDPQFDLVMDRLKHLDDDALIAVVYQRLAMPTQARMNELSRIGKEGRATDDEVAELEALNDLLDRQILLRSEALLQLHRRGHDVNALFGIGI